MCNCISRDTKSKKLFTALFSFAGVIAGNSTYFQVTNLILRMPWCYVYKPAGASLPAGLSCSSDTSGFFKGIYWEQLKMDMTGFAKGIYFISVRDEDNNVTVKKFVKM